MATHRAGAVVLVALLAWASMCGHAALDKRNCEEISKDRNMTAIDDRADLVLNITQEDVDQGRVSSAVEEEEFCWKQQVDLDLYHFFALVEDGDWPNAEKKYREDDAVDKDTKYTNAYHSLEHFALHPSSSKSHYFPFMREDNAMKIRSLLNDTFKDEGVIADLNDDIKEDIRKETAEKLGICLQAAYSAHHLAHAVADIEGNNPNPNTALDNLAEGFMLYFGRTGGGAHASAVEYDTDHRTGHTGVLLEDISDLADEIRNETVSQESYQSIMRHLIMPFIQAVEKYAYELQYNDGGAEAWGEAYAYWSCIRGMFPDGEAKDTIQDHLTFENKTTLADVPSGSYDKISSRIRDNVGQIDTYDVSEDGENKVFDDTSESDVTPSISKEDIGEYVIATADTSSATAIVGASTLLAIGFAVLI